MRLLLLLPFIVACSALPMDGSVLDTIKGRPKGEAAQAPDVCNCEIEVTCN